jgi:repressor LexA
MEDLTQRQREVLAALQRLHDQHGFAPSLREVASEVGLASTSSVHPTW